MRFFSNAPPIIEPRVIKAAANTAKLVSTLLAKTASLAILITKRVNAKYTNPSKISTPVERIVTRTTLSSSLIFSPPFFYIFRNYLTLYFIASF